MDLKQLLYFKTVVEEGTISAAAKKLNLSQPPLSQQIKQLESELGVTLMERGARKITLNEAGRVLYEKACTLLTLAEQTVQELRDIHDGLEGTLTLGTISSSGAIILSDALPAFHSLHPHIRFELHEGTTFQVIDLLNAGIIELGIVRTPFHSEGFETHFLESEPMVAVGAPAFFEGISSDIITLQALSQKPLIYYRRFESLIEGAFESAGLPSKAVCKNDDARTSLMWANAGIGVAVIPSSASRIIASANTVCKNIGAKVLNTQVALIWRKGHTLSRIARSFLTFF